MQWQTRRQNLGKQKLHFLLLANIIGSKNKLINDSYFSNGHNVYFLLILLRNFWHIGDKKVITILLAWRQSCPPTNPKSSRETQLAQLKKTGFRLICEQMDEWIILIFPLLLYLRWVSVDRYRFSNVWSAFPLIKVDSWNNLLKKALQIQAASRNKQRTYARKWTSWLAWHITFSIVWWS